MSAPQKLAASAGTIAKASTVRKPSSLPKLPPNSRKIDGKTTAATANYRFHQSISSSVISLSPDDVYTTIRLNTEAGKFVHNLTIAAKIRQDPLKKRFCTPKLYVLLLQSLAAESDPNHGPLSLELFREMSQTSCTTEDLTAASEALYKSFHNCRNFTQLLGLKIIFQSVLARRMPTSDSALKYLSCHMHVLLNSGQLSLAIDHFHQCLSQLQSSRETRGLLQTLPMKKLINELCIAQDCDSLLRVIEEVVSSECTDIIAFSEWSEILGTALSKSDFSLVKIIYSRVIMEGIDPQTLDDSVLEIGLTKNNTFLRSLGEETLHQILHTLAAHGDVSSCLNLIEWHFMHKTLLGEKALTKELCLQIIRAYCYHTPDFEVFSHADKDNSVKSVLDVIESFVSKKRHKYEYKDVVDAFSHKLNMYRAFDENVAHATSKETRAPFVPPSFGAEETPEEDVVLKKKSNKNVHESTSGSVLKNTAILSKFITDHLTYISEKQYSEDTRRIFINCVLAHLATYQNSSAIVLALQQMKTMDPNFLKIWLDFQSCDIIVQSFAVSPAAMNTGLVFYQHMKSTGIPISEKMLKRLVYSSLRGHTYNQLLEYYMYEYLKSAPKCVSPHLLARIRSFKQLNDDGRILLKSIESYQPDDLHRIDENWDAHQFTKIDPKIVRPDEEYVRFFEFDHRDKQILKEILV